MSGRGQFTKALATAVAGLLFATAAADAAPRIEVLSNRADLISGGDALVRVTPAPRSVTVGGREVGASLAKREDGSAQGLITGLAVGKNVVVARFARGARARITIDNHPIGGPIFSGRQTQPWICNTQNPPANSGTSPTVVPVGLGPPRDAQCNTPSATGFVYKSSSSGGFQAYDPDKPPADSEIARTTTDQGKTVPYIVRQEFGVQNRGIYAIATLAEPGAWNHKLLTYFGASTAPDHLQSQPSAVLDDMALSRGFMTANSSMNVNGQNTNQNVSAESLMMLKEHITEHFGGIRYTIGQGCSGGSYQSMIASMYPGLLDGIQPNCSYTDLWTTAPDVVDCGLLVKYFASNPAMPWVPSIDGHKEPSDCAAWYSLFFSVQDPGRQENCKLPDEQVYDPATRPSLTRCTIQDYQEAIWGRRPESQWGPVEKQLGRGFANRAYGNEGIEYGRRALDAGEITPAQFVDLNEKIGGLDIDHKPQAARAAVDENTAAIAYRTSQVVDGRQLATVPIIDLRAYSESGEIHTSFYSYKTRARLDEANGTHASQLIWTFPASEPILGVSPPPAIVEKSFLLMDDWLARIEADRSGAPLAQKVLGNKPGDATDKCFVGSPGAPAIGTPSGPVTEVQDPAQCAMLYPHYGNTRTAAGGPDTDDIIQCRLKPLDPKGFTDAQAATLRKVFPNGVCDYSQPGLGEQPSQPWITFEDGPGGRPLGPAPRSTATSCARTSALARARVSVVRKRKLRVRAPRGTKVAILRHDRRGVHRVKRAARDGYYVVRLRLRGETRRVALRRSHGRLKRRPAIERVGSRCTPLRFFRLDRAAFGRALPARYRVRRAARARITVLRGKRVLRRTSVRSARPGRTYRLKVRGARLPRGDVRVRLTLKRGRANDHHDPDREAPVILRPLAVALAAALLLPAAAAAQDPGTADWQQVPRDRMAAECGLDPDLLDAAAPKLEATPFVVIRHGKLCWEGGAPGSTTEKYSVFSVTKTFGAMLFGMIASRGKLSDEDPVSDWIRPEDLGSINPKAKLAHVLAMVSTNADLRPGHKEPWSYDTAGDREINHLVGVMDRAIKEQPDHFPGAADAVELAQKDLFDPLGMRTSSWEGGQIAGNLQTSVRDMARLGQLVLQRGRWQGRRLIDEEYLYRMTHPAFEDVNTGYGYLTYVNAAANWHYPTSTADLNCAPFGRWPSYPHRPFHESANSNGGVPEEREQPLDIAHTFASGTGGQKFIIYRGLDMVIATRNGVASVGDGGTAVDQFPSHKTVWNALRPALLKYDPVYKNDEAGFCAAYRRSDYAPSLREPWFKEQSAPAGQPPRRCTSRRRFKITIRKPRGMKVRKVKVTLDGRRIRVVRGKRMRARIDLRGRPPGKAVVRIRLTGTRRGKPATVKHKRVFRTCTPKR